MLTMKQLIRDSLNGIRITQTIFAAAINTPDRGGGSLEGTAAGSWSVQVVEQSQAEACYWLHGDSSKGCEGGDGGGKHLWKKP